MSRVFVAFTLDLLASPTWPIWESAQGGGGVQRVGRVPPQSLLSKVGVLGGVYPVEVYSCSGGT